MVCHPTPLQPKEIVRRIRQHGATILLSTDTFINQYARCGDDERPAHPAPGGVRRRAAARRDPRLRAQEIPASHLLEGYGVTEASPVVAANQIEANHPGTVGRLMAGMQARLEPVEGIAGAGAALCAKAPTSCWAISSRTRRA